MSAPVQVGLAGMPSRVTIFEAGPRDGLQNEATTLPVEAKAEFIERLIAAGVRAIELTSLVRPDRVPPLADAEELLRRVTLPDRVRAVVSRPMNGLCTVRQTLEYARSPCSRAARNLLATQTCGARSMRLP